MAAIIYQNQIFDKKHLQNANLANIKDSYLQETLTFCQKWLLGEEIYEIKTSGSTGTPKLIQPTRRAMQASVQMSQRAFAWQGGEKALVCLHTQYIAGIMMLVRGLELDWTMYLQAPSHNPLADFDKPLDFAAFVPLQMQNILEKNPEKLSLFTNQSNIILGGAAISMRLEEEIEKVLSPPIFQTYGMTETLSHIALRKLNGKEKEISFTPLAGVKIRLDNRKCLCISSPTTLFQEIITNDIAELEENGSFRVLGRADNIINSGGVKIQLEEVEKAIEKIFVEIGLQKRFYCIGIADDYWGQMIALCIEGESLPQNIDESLHQAFKKIPNKYYIPKKIIYQAKFAETETGKIKRQILERN